MQPSYLLSPSHVNLVQISTYELNHVRSIILHKVIELSFNDMYTDPNIHKSIVTLSSFYLNSYQPVYIKSDLDHNKRTTKRRTMCPCTPFTNPAQHRTI